MNKSILITGANAGLGKETARQLSLQQETTRIIMGCRNIQKAEVAKKELEAASGRNIFEILIMDVSNAESVKKAIEQLEGSVDALIMNAGGMGGRTPNNKTESGMNELAASNILGHVVLVEGLIEAGKLNKIAMLATSEGILSVKKKGLKNSGLKTHSSEELVSILDGDYFGKKFSVMQGYQLVKYVATLYMSSLSRKYPDVKFISMSPGATSGTSVADNTAPMMKFMWNNIMPIFFSLFGMGHKVDKGASRFVDAISNNKYNNGGVYASKENKMAGEVVDQFEILPALANTNSQDNAYEAVHKFLS